MSGEPGGALNHQRLRALARVTGYVTVGLGSVALVGWLFDLPALKSVLPGHVTMKANTAICFIFAGASLLLQLGAKGGERRVSWGRAFAVGVAILGGLTLVQDLVRLDLRIDQLFVNAPGEEIETSTPGRMAPVAAFNFLLAGAALFLVHTKRRPLARLVVPLAVVPLLSGFVATTGHTLGVQALYGIAGYTSMALHTSVGFLALPFGLLLARSDSSILTILAQDTLAGSAIRRLLPLVAITPLFVGWVRLAGQRAGHYGGEFGVGLMVTFCTLIFSSLAIWNAYVQGDSERAQQRERRDDAFLASISDQLGDAASADVALALVSQSLGEYLGVSRCMFVQIDPAAQLTTVHSDYHHDVPSVAGARPLSDYSADSIKDAKAGRTVVNNDASIDARTRELYPRAYLPASIRSYVAVPCLRSGEWLGTLLVSRSHRSTWAPREIALVQFVAGRTWEWVERLHAQHALKESQARLLAILNSAFDAIVTMDHDGRVVEFNAAAERLFGYKRAEALGQEMAELIVPASMREAHRAGLRRHLDTGQETILGRVMELTAQRADGTEFAVELAVSRVTDHLPPLFTGSLRDITERKRNTDRLRASLKEREVLLQEVHHRVKNNLQIIASLINMQVRQISDVPTRSALAECQSRVLAISLIHEKLYQSDDYARVPFSEYARSLAANIFHATGTSPSSVSLDLAIESFSLAVDKAIPCGLILNELISNALKHAFPEERKGRIRVVLRKVTEEDAMLSVFDDGVGLSEKFELEQSNSLGMQLVSTLVEQLEGKLQIDQEQGTSFNITFPVEG